MICGFEVALSDAVIESFDAHQNMATQILSNDKVKRYSKYCVCLGNERIEI